jgi:hypothetical protein
LRVELYTKPGCHLCDVAKDVLVRVQERIPFELVERDITSDAALFDRYRYDIPVVVVPGRRTFVHRVYASQLELALTSDGDQAG